MKKEETPPVTIAIGSDCVLKHFPDLNLICLIVTPNSVQYLSPGAW